MASIKFDNRLVEERWTQRNLLQKSRYKNVLHIQSTFFRIFYIYLIFRSRRGCWNSGGHVDVQYKKKNFLEELTRKWSLFSLLATNVAAVTSLAKHQFLTSDDFVEKPMENDAAKTASAGTHIEAQHVVEFLTI